MPEPDVDVEVASVRVTWREVRFTGPGRVRLTSDALHLESAAGVLVIPLADLQGGAWRAGAITIHGEAGNVTLQSTPGLERAWASITERACPLPEFARSHRLLGSRRGGRSDLQARFLAPLLQARKRLEDATDLEVRVATLDARVLRERVDSALKSVAAETFPLSQPDRRGLEAELEEAMAGLFLGLEAMESAAGTFRSAPEAIRFVAWREWVSAVSTVFAMADSGWASASRLLPRPSRP